MKYPSETPRESATEGNTRREKIAQSTNKEQLLAIKMKEPGNF